MYFLYCFYFSINIFEILNILLFYNMDGVKEQIISEIKNNYKNRLNDITKILVKNINIIRLSQNRNKRELVNKLMNKYKFDIQILKNNALSEINYIKNYNDDLNAIKNEENDENVVLSLEEKMGDHLVENDFDKMSIDNLSGFQEEESDNLEEVNYIEEAEVMESEPKVMESEAEIMESVAEIMESEAEIMESEAEIMESEAEIMESEEEVMESSEVEEMHNKETEEMNLEPEIIKTNLKTIAETQLENKKTETTTNTETITTTTATSSIIETITKTITIITF